MFDINLTYRVIHIESNKSANPLCGRHENVLEHQMSALEHSIINGEYFVDPTSKIISACGKQTQLELCLECMQSLKAYTSVSEYNLVHLNRESEFMSLCGVDEIDLPDGHTTVTRKAVDFDRNICPLCKEIEKKINNNMIKLLYETSF